jgi:hypothetical protein
MKVYAYILLFFYLLGMQPQGREHVCTCEKTAEVNTCQQDKEMTSCCATNSNCETKAMPTKHCKKGCGESCRCVTNPKPVVLLAVNPLVLPIIYAAQPEDHYRFTFITVQLPIWVPPEIS